MSQECLTKYPQEGKRSSIYVARIRGGGYFETLNKPLWGIPMECDSRKK